MEGLMEALTGVSILSDGILLYGIYCVWRMARDLDRRVGEMYARNTQLAARIRAMRWEIDALNRSLGRPAKSDYYGGPLDEED